MAFTQSIEIAVKNKPITDVFYQIRDQYQVEFSFNSDDLKDYSITKSATYSNAEEAIADLLSESGFTYRKKGNIFLIVKNKKVKQSKEKKPDYHYYAGFIADAQVGERLPSALIKYNHGYLTTTASGYFNFRSTDSLENLQIQYLGYYTKDTLLSPDQSLQIQLKSADYYLQEFEVVYKEPIFDMISGQEAGKTTLNQMTSRYLPGNMDNGIYNMLRLQPGIMASGEQSNDYTIWGSWPGQNIVEYDYIKLFSISSFDGNQSIVHPLMVKEIDVSKGGFGAEYGNGVGGLVDITGKNGDEKNFHGNANINNQAVSGYLNIPITDQLSLQTAYRQTFYNIFKSQETVQGMKNGKMYFIPETSFRDFNVKFAGKINPKDQFFINVLASEDQLSYDFNTDNGNNGNFSAQKNHNKTQTGFSANLNKFYRNESHSSTILSYTILNNKVDFSRNFINHGQGQNNFSINSNTSNEISEFNINHTHHFLLGKKNTLSVGGEIVRNANALQNEIDNEVAREFQHESNRLGLILKDDLSLFNNIIIHAGLRTDFIPERKQVFLQPRINLSYHIFDQLKLNAAYGKYYQYLYKSTIFNNKDVLLDFWEILDTDKQEATYADHYILGMSYQNKFFNINAEGFYKSIHNIYTYNYNLTIKDLSRSLLRSQITGLDLYIKAKLGKHEIWAAYTLSQTMQRFETDNSDVYQLAPHNQTHEIKAAAIVNLAPFYISTNYVYGSGLEFTRDLETDQLIPYNRFDASVMYKLDINKVYCQFGISALNIFNTYNIKYNNLIRLPNDELVYSQTTPFTLLVNIYIGF